MSIVTILSILQLIDNIKDTYNSFKQNPHQKRRQQNQYHPRPQGMLRRPVRQPRNFPNRQSKFRPRSFWI